MTNKTPAMILHELSIKETGSPPVFNTMAHVEGTHENEFVCDVSVLGTGATAKGRSKKEAKQEAARKALTILALQGIYHIEGGVSAGFPNPLEEAELKQVVNYIGELEDLCVLHSIPQPEIVEISAVGPPHAMEFTYECRLSNSMRTRATANTKRMAKQIVAHDMLDRMKDIVPMIVKEQEVQQLKLCANEELAKEKYTELSILKRSNLGLLLKDYNNTLRNLAKEKELTYDQLKIHLEPPHNECKLSLLLEELGLEYRFEDLTDQDDTEYIYALDVTLESPLCTVSIGDSREQAKDEALCQMFQMISCFLS